MTSKSDEHVGPQNQTGLSSPFWILNAHFLQNGARSSRRAGKKHVFLTTAGIVHMIRIIIYAFVGRTEGIMGLTFFAATESDVWQITTSSRVVSWH